MEEGCHHPYHGPPGEDDGQRNAGGEENGPGD